MAPLDEPLEQGGRPFVHRPDVPLDEPVHAGPVVLHSWVMMPVQLRVARREEDELPHEQSGERELVDAQQALRPGLRAL